ncbi:uncharacterized protein LOC117175709 [Belonocnema kinseyi]|uniref:uncharacterized protein LOC117175709 n=1 Tax=Belonocnema kinseyi TaxID=2817044 RepID=UPI00143E019B|nr:uncharacterized protein LOC117175709 [Belonocnema kinseyi]
MLKMKHVMSFFAPELIFCLKCIIYSHAIDVPDHIATHLNGNLSSYRDAMNWLYKYENHSCNSENVTQIMPEGKEKYLMFHIEYTEFRDEFVSKMINAAKSDMIYAIYKSCLLDANYLKHTVKTVLVYKLAYIRECHPEILFEGENEEFMKATVQIITNELCSKITYQTIYSSDEECQKNVQPEEIKKCEIFIQKKNRRKYTNHMTGFLIYALNDYFPSSTCSDIIKRRNCYVDLVKNCKFSTQFAAYNLWSLSRNDPLCTTELRESIGEETRS